MTYKLLTWIGGALFAFCLAKKISDLYDCEISAVIDVDNQKKNFFETQKLTKFQNTWYYREHVDVDPNRKPDMEYLISFEKKTGISLWNLAFSERAFYKYNDYYQFKYNEILSILEQECKLFEQVLDEVKPDFLIIGVTDSHNNTLFSDLCKARKIPVLMLGGSRFGGRDLISSEVDTLDGDIKPSYGGTKENKTLDELREYLYKFDSTKALNKFKEGAHFSPFAKAKKFFKLVFIFGRKDYQNHYLRRGMSSFNILKTLPILYLKRRNANNFANKNFKRNLNDELPFVYYPLHSDPERALLIAAPFYTNQIEIITSIAKSIPVGYKLFVKDHPIIAIKGGRKSSFYKEIMKLPNVQLIHPSVKQEEILKKASLVITISGTAGLEAAFYGKPSIIFTHTLFSSLPSVYELKNIEELPSAIRTSLDRKVNPSDLQQFIEFINNNSFELERHLWAIDIRIRFHQKKIPESAMKAFMDEYDSQLEILALEYIKKIKKYKDKK